MRCFFVIRSYTFWSSSHTFLPAFYYNLLNSHTFLYVLCNSHADSTKSMFSIDFGPDSMVGLPHASRGELLAILCRSSLSIKFPCVLLYVLMRSGRPITSWSSGTPTLVLSRRGRHQRLGIWMWVKVMPLARPRPDSLRSSMFVGFRSCRLPAWIPASGLPLARHRPDCLRLFIFGDSRSRQPACAEHCKPFATELRALQSIHALQVLVTCCATLPCVLKHCALFPACFESCH